jgi:polar amino acid transport system substrate-binding protein
MQNTLHIDHGKVGLSWHIDEYWKAQRCLIQAVRNMPWFSLVLLLAVLCMVSSTVAAQTQPANNVLVLGVRADAPPFSYREEGQTEKYQGYSVTLCKQIAKRAIKEGLYCKSIYKEVSADNRFQLLQTGEIDILCGATTVTLERMRVADFSLFTFLSGTSVMYPVSGAKQNSRQKTKESSQEDVFRVGVLKGTTTEGEIERIIRHFQDFGLNEITEIKVVRYDDHYQGLDQLVNHEIEAYLADREILLALKQRQNEKKDSSVDLKVSQEYFSLEPYAIALHRGNWDLRYIANSVLSEMFGGNSPGDNKMHIFDLLRQSFPGKKFSKSLEYMFLIQRLSVGVRLDNEPLEKADCPADSH